MQQPDLGQKDIIRKIDKEGMLEVVENFPAQCEQAVSVASKTPLNMQTPTIDSVLIMGMGGSGISGDIIKTVLEPGLKIPIYVNKGYQIPPYVSENTLCFAVSYSGNTEETMAGFDQAISRGCKVVSVSTGGTLSKKAGSSNLPLVRIPKGLQPRAALGYLALPILVVLGRLNVIDDMTSDIKEMVQLMQEKRKIWGSEVSMKENQAQMTALRLFRKVPVIYGSKGLTSVVSFRWKCQFNETSKVPSFWHTFPELNHNETVGWGLLSDVTTNFCLVLLRDAYENPRVKKRIEITRSLIEKHFGDVIEVSSDGKSLLARIFSLIYLGDFVSVYLAILNGVDPSPVKRVEELKKRLGK